MGFKVDFRHQGALYSIEVQNPDHVQKGVAEIDLDGRILITDYLPLDPEPVKHIVRIQLGTRSLDKGE